MTKPIDASSKPIAHDSPSQPQETSMKQIPSGKTAARVPVSRRDHPNRLVDILKVATAMLDGEIEYRRANYASAFEHLCEAIRHDDALLYTEPRGWMLPTRHAYAEDLGLDPTLTRAHQHPDSVWALHGFHECLVRLGRLAEARIIKPRLDFASSVADVEIRSSCFFCVGWGAEY
ncbi:TPR domain protein [Penicillium alfredii]|uniref:TPR domain protein n=1 Tax=Penicillium alfredii TaxID=1506179 RepID=A0A9W9KFX9_9EURO|nr:TPR domain protein [Penicillium alfredii]KAJ5105044.1 TPR domain protein [Penicillium alfredii]